MSNLPMPILLFQSLKSVFIRTFELGKIHYIIPLLEFDHSVASGMSDIYLYTEPDKDIPRYYIDYYKTSYLE